MTDDPSHVEDDELDPNLAPKSSKAWLAQIVEAERAFESYQNKADAIDRLYADLAKLSNVARDREFQLFWANIQVLAPSIYARPPVPVVVPRFRDRRPINRTTSEVLERCTATTFDISDINSVMLLVRDDLAIAARGAAWVRYETKAESDTKIERLCIEHKDRKDFLHEPSRNWMEVGWVAGASYLTKKEMRKRFRKTSGDAYQKADYSVQREDRDNGAADNRRKAKVWEVWSKSENKVVWVAKDVDVLLDEDKPHLKLEGFFPCPKPAYATTQRRSLIPVPDMLYYKDQLEEINQLTARIHALSEALRVKGFYAAGGDIGQAVEAAMKLNDPGKVMVPVSNWAAFGTAGDVIVWLPIDMVAQTVAGVVDLRKAVIDDVYQIMGLSDIMRGATAASETATAQQLKSQYGSVRIRDKQMEMVRIARDIARIAAEIMAENFDEETILDMSQMELPTTADIEKQLDVLEKQANQIADATEAKIKQAKANPQLMEQAQANPEEAQKALQQVQQQAQEQLQSLQAQAEKLSETVTIDQVMDLLRDQKLRPFILDIETDSTIAPDEDAQKQRATEFVTAVGGFLNQAVTAANMMPQIAPLMADTLKFVASQFRAGRELDGSIDEFADAMKQMASQPQANPEADAAQAQQQAEQQKLAMEQQRLQADMQMKQAEMEARMQEGQMKAQADAQMAQFEMQSKQAEAEQRAQENDAKLQQISASMQRDQQKGDLEMQKLQMEIEAKREELAIKAQSAQIDAAVQVQQAEIQASSAEQQADQADQAFRQKSALTAQQAAAKANQTEAR